MKPIQGRNALVTGASRGLGAEIARALAGRGVNLVLAARGREGLEATAASVAEHGVRVEILQADVSVAEDLAGLGPRAEAALGPIDILVNNAGIEWVAHFDRMDPEQIATMVQTNLLAALTLTRHVIPGMLERKRGHVMTLSSLGGKKGSPYSATYAATKAGLIAWSNALREELRGSGVSASVVCPGFVSEVGMFAVYNKRAPKIAGEVTPAAVCKAVLKALTKDVGEIIVNPGATRLMLILDAIDARIMSWVLRRFGVYEFYRQQAEDNEAQRV